MSDLLHFSEMRLRRDEAGGGIWQPGFGNFYFANQDGLVDTGGMKIPVRIGVRSELVYAVEGDATFLLNIAAAETPTQRVLHETLVTSPGVALSEVPTSGPPGRFHRFRAVEGPMEIRYEAEVELMPDFSTEGGGEASLGELPPDVIPFLYPSRYCESDKLVRMARRSFGELPAGHERVCGICNWIYEQVEYVCGSSDATTSAFDTATERAGVCRDFAHLAIAFCRALGIPARFCSSYAYRLEPADFHAHFEAWLDGRWLIYDATRLAPQSGFVRIGTGHDAADTSIATITGPVRFDSLCIEVVLLSEETQFPGFAEGPVG